jgi:hypothetical protein
MEVVVNVVDVEGGVIYCVDRLSTRFETDLYQISLLSSLLFIIPVELRREWQRDEIPSLLCTGEPGLLSL